MRILAGKVALVTDGSDGSGAAMARELAGQGVHVAIGYRSSPDHADILAHELEDHGIQAMALRLDDGADGGTGQAVATVARWFGRIDLLVDGIGGAVHELGGRPANDGADLPGSAGYNAWPDPDTLAFWPGVSWPGYGTIGVQELGMTQVRFIRPAVAEDQDLLPPPSKLFNDRARPAREEYSRMA